MKLNKKMESILNNYFDKSVDVSLEQIVDKSIIEPKFKFINECILIDNRDEIDEDTLNWEYIFSWSVDRTGFEAYENDIQLNGYIKEENLKDYELVKLGILVLENWRKSIEKLIGNKKCEFVMTLNNGDLTLRVYLIREGESWLDSDLENYEQDAIAIF